MVKSGRYASYWNAFLLFKNVLRSLTFQMTTVCTLLNKHPHLPMEYMNDNNHLFVLFITRHFLSFQAASFKSADSNQWSRHQHDRGSTAALRHQVRL